MVEALHWPMWALDGARFNEAEARTPRMRELAEEYPVMIRAGLQ